jgi:hypothetical protein
MYTQEQRKGGFLAAKSVSFWACAVIPESGGEEAAPLTLQLPDGKMEKPLERIQTIAGMSSYM